MINFLFFSILFLSQSSFAQKNCQKIFLNDKQQVQGQFLFSEGESSSTLGYLLDGMTIGYIEFKIEKNDNVVIDMIYIEPKNQGKGLSTMLLKELIDRVGHEKKFKATLIGTNSDVFVAKYNQISNQKSSRFNPTQNKEQRELLALMSTPFYKSLSKLDISEIVSYKVLGCENSICKSPYLEIILKKKS